VFIFNRHHFSFIRKLFVKYFLLFAIPPGLTINLSPGKNLEWQNLNPANSRHIVRGGGGMATHQHPDTSEN
jgi:hypothetical protein